jgi:pimeloyl-ACP methyl ester carboxylesterase
MERFVDYWSAPGAFARMRPALQDRLIRWAPKAPLDFHALINNPLAADAYTTLDIPTLILCGEHAPRPTRIIAHRLAELLPRGRVIVVPVAGHLGPITHPEIVSPLMARHIRESASTQYSRRALRQSPQPRAWQPLEAVP